MQLMMTDICLNLPCVKWILAETLLRLDNRVDEGGKKFMRPKSQYLQVRP